MLLMKQDYFSKKSLIVFLLTIHSAALCAHWKAFSFLLIFKIYEQFVFNDENYYTFDEI